MTAPLLVIVTGAPAAGKSTVALRLASDLSLPLITKDDFKEALFDSLGVGDRDWSRRLGAASFDLLYVVAGALLAAGTSVILEANFPTQRAHERFTVLAAQYPFQALQVHCVVPLEVLRERYARRAATGERHPGHLDALIARRTDLTPERFAPPLPDSPVVTVDTSGPAPVGYDAALQAAREFLEQ